MSRGIGWPGPLPASPESLGGDLLRALVSLAHIEHPGGLDGDDLRLTIGAAHDRGDDRDALLALVDDATGFQRRDGCTLRASRTSTDVGDCAASWRLVSAVVFGRLRRFGLWTQHA